MFIIVNSKTVGTEQWSTEDFISMKVAQLQSHGD